MLTLQGPRGQLDDPLVTGPHGLESPQWALQEDNSGLSMIGMNHVAAGNAVWFYTASLSISSSCYLAMVLVMAFRFALINARINVFVRAIRRAFLVGLDPPPPPPPPRAFFYDRSSSQHGSLSILASRIHVTPLMTSCPSFLHTRAFPFSEAILSLRFAHHHVLLSLTPSCHTSVFISPPPPWRIVALPRLAVSLNSSAFSSAFPLLALPCHQDLVTLGMTLTFIVICTSAIATCAFAEFNDSFSSFWEAWLWTWTLAITVESGDFLAATFKLESGMDLNPPQVAAGSGASPAPPGCCPVCPAPPLPLLVTDWSPLCGAVRCGAMCGVPPEDTL